MKVEKLLKVPRLVRTIKLEIQIPEPSVPRAAAPHPPKPTRRTRAWEILKVAGPAAVAIAAIAISFLSLQGQQAADREAREANAIARQANAAAAAASQRQNATQVSFLQTALPQSPFTSMQIENHATTPIYEVTVQAETSVFNKFNGGPKGQKGYIAALAGGSSYFTKKFTFYVGDIPACSSGAATNLVTAATYAMLNTKKLAPAVIGINPVAVDVLSMSFKDSNGTAWQYSDLGGLRKLADLPANTYFPDAYLGTRHKDATGCI